MTLVPGVRAAPSSEPAMCRPRIYALRSVSRPFSLSNEFLRLFAHVRTLMISDSLAIPRSLALGWPWGRPAARLPSRSRFPCVQTRRERAERRSLRTPRLGVVVADEVRSRSTSSRRREQCSNHQLQRGRRVPQTQRFAPTACHERPFPRVAGYRHLPASERQGGGGARGSLECLPEIRADRCRRMRHHAARVMPNPPPRSGPDP